MFCSNCGTQVNDNVKFCGNCGNSLIVTTNNNTISSNTQTQFNSINSKKIFYIKIKGIKSGIDTMINWIQYGSFIIPVILGCIFEAIEMERVSNFFFLIAIPLFILSFFIIQKGILIDTIKGVIILHPKSKLSFLKEEVEIADIKSIKVEKYKLSYTILNLHILNVLFSSCKFDNIALLNKNNRRLINIQFVKKGNSDEFLIALQEMCKIMNRDDILINIDEEVKKDIADMTESTIKKEENKNQ